MLVIGEALIDIVANAKRAQPEEHVGGSPANVALALGRLGNPVRLLTALGRDARGERIERHLNGSGVVIDPRSWMLDRTSTARATIGSDGAATYDFDITWALQVAPEPITETVVHVGSIAAFLLPGADAVWRIVEHVDGDAIISFDPNIRPALLHKRRRERRLNRAPGMTRVDLDAPRARSERRSLIDLWLPVATADALSGMDRRGILAAGKSIGANPRQRASTRSVVWLARAFVIARVADPLPYLTA